MTAVCSCERDGARAPRTRWTVGGVGRSLDRGPTVSTATRHQTTELDRVVIRFAGDSGDGMQLTGTQFTSVSSAFGNDTATLPDFPAEIRAPAGTLAGVSAFQVHISDHDILTPGDAPSVLVAMNPAALKTNVGAVPPGGTIIVNVDAFDERAFEKANYSSNPLTDGSLAGYKVYEVPMTSLTMEVAKAAGVKPRDAERSKNFFALGLVSWLYSRPVEGTLELDREAVRQQPHGARRQHPGLQGGLQLRRDGRALRGQLPGPPGRPGARRLHQRHRQHGPGLGPDRRRPPGASSALPRVLPDHPGLGHPPRAVQAQALRGAHGAGRGRDRRRRRRHRRRLRGCAGRHHHQRSRHRTSSRSPSAWR